MKEVTVKELKTMSVQELEGRAFSEMGECCGFDARVDGDAVVCAFQQCGRGYLFEKEKVSFEKVKDAILHLCATAKLDSNGRVMEDVEVEVEGAGFGLVVSLDKFDHVDDFYFRVGGE